LPSKFGVAFSGSLMGAASAHFHFAGQYSVRETNAQPAPITGLFKGVGTLSQQTKQIFGGHAGELF
jgi:hypothetical protein